MPSTDSPEPRTTPSPPAGSTGRELPGRAAETEAAGEPSGDGQAAAGGRGGLGARTAERGQGGRGWGQKLLPWLVALVALGGLVLAFAARYLVDDEPTLELRLEGRVAVLPFAVDAARTDSWVAWGLAALVTETLEASEPVPVVPLRRLHGTFTARGLAIDDPGSRARARELAAAVGGRVIVDGTYREDGDTVVLDVGFFDADGRELDRRRVPGDDALAAAGLLAYSIADSLGRGAAPVALDQAFSRDPFVDRLYAEGVHAWMISTPARRAAEAQPYFEIALRHEPTFLQAKARLVDCLRAGGLLAEARTLAEELLKESQAMGARAVQAKAFRDLGMLAALDGDSTAALEQYRQAHRLEQGRADLAGQSEALYEQARLALAESDDPRAEELFVEVANLREGLGDRLGHVDALLRLGSLTLSGGRLEAAEGFLERARTLAVEMRDPWDEHRAIASLGEVAWRQGRLEEAAELWRQALVFSRQQEDGPRLLLLSHNVAKALRLLGRAAEAETLYQDQLELARQAGDRRLEADAALRLAWLSLRQGYPFQARDHLDAALELDRYLDDRDDLRRVIAWLAYEQGNYDLAIETMAQLERSATTAWTGSDTDFLAVFRKAKEEDRRLPVPGEEDFVG